MVAERLGTEWQVRPEGMNGRQLPDLPCDEKWIRPLLRDLHAGDVFSVMLGTNVLLVTTEPDAAEPVRRMRAFLHFLRAEMPETGILVIAPPWVGSEQSRDPAILRYRETGREMNEGFRQEALRAGVFFADAAQWQIDLSADQVHFSEKGHRQFAGNMTELLQAITGSAEEGEGKKAVWK